MEILRALQKLEVGVAELRATKIGAKLGSNGFGASAAVCQVAFVLFLFFFFLGGGVGLPKIKSNQIAQASSYTASQKGSPRAGIFGIWVKPLASHEAGSSPSPPGASIDSRAELDLRDIFFGAFCLGVRTLTLFQSMGFP